MADAADQDVDLHVARTRLPAREGERRKRPREPVVYEPSILIIAQSRKIGYLGDETYVYDANNYLVLPVPLPFECATVVTPAKPLLGVAIRVDPVMIAGLLLQMDDRAPAAGPVRGIYSTPLTEELADATVRLLQCLREPIDNRVLGGAIVRDIIYRVLCGEQSAALRAVAARHGSFSQIGQVLRRIHVEYAQPVDVDVLARDAGMSVSTFHAAFKAVTSTSPLQYIKSIRLHKARALMMQNGLNASSAANASAMRAARSSAESSSVSSATRRQRKVRAGEAEQPQASEYRYAPTHDAKIISTNVHTSTSVTRPHELRPSTP